MKMKENNYLLNYLNWKKAESNRPNKKAKTLTDLKKKHKK